METGSVLQAAWALESVLDLNLSSAPYLCFFRYIAFLRLDFFTLKILFGLRNVTVASMKQPMSDFFACCLAVNPKYLALPHFNEDLGDGSGE